MLGKRNTAKLNPGTGLCKCVPHGIKSVLSYKLALATASACDIILTISYLKSIISFHMYVCYLHKGTDISYYSINGIINNEMQRINRNDNRHTAP